MCRRLGCSPPSSPVGMCDGGLNVITTDSGTVGIQSGNVGKHIHPNTTEIQYIIEGSGDAIPARHGNGLRSAYVRHSCHHDIAEPERPAHQNDFKLDRGADRELPGAEKIDASGTDVASDEGNREFLGDSAGAPKT